MNEILNIVIVLIGFISIVLSVTSLCNIIRVNKEISASIEKIEFTNRLLQSIDATIQIEVVKKIKLSSMLGQPYRLMDFDNDVSSISTDIFNSFNNDIFVNNRTIYTNNYIMSYITTNVSIVLFDYIQTYERGTQ